jgi:uncharacterized membrane protein YsdA (DUF1294 family)
MTIRSLPRPSYQSVDSADEGWRLITRARSGYNIMLPAVPESPLLDWVALASLLGFAAMGVDKLLAVERLSRVSERTLWLIALVGGFLGIFVGGVVFHHKTSKAEFWAPVGVAVVLWATVVILAVRPQVF